MSDLILGFAAMVLLLIGTFFAGKRSSGKATREKRREAEKRRSQALEEIEGESDADLVDRLSR